MNQAGVIELLEYTDLFGGLSEKSKKMLAEIAISKSFTKGETIFSEDDKAFSVYLLGSGSVELSKSTASSRKIVIRIIQPGEIFGEVILFEKDKYPATAIALRTSTLFILPKQQFTSLLDSATFRQDFIGLLMAKQRYLTQRLIDFQAHDVDERLFLFIKEHFGKRNKIQPGMSKKDMAAAIGTIPETFSRLLLRLKKEDLLHWEEKEIVITAKFWDIFEPVDLS